MNQTPRSPRQPARAHQGLMVAAACAGWACGTMVLAAPNPPRTAQQAAPAQVARDGWKDCSFNDVTIGCVDQPLPDGIRLVWKDGLRMTYRLVHPAQAGAPAELRDQLGGIWRRQILAQGNTVLMNGANGARIVVPLRFPCKPPLKGEVGYCHN